MAKTFCYALILIFIFQKVGYSDISDASPAEIEWIADLIFNNECNRKEDCLVAWNEGEDFPSLGISHFIWYPKSKKGPFDESFPKFLAFLEMKGTPLPGWLNELPGREAPWETREDFIQDLDGEKIQRLKSFLMETRDSQIEYMIARFKKAIPEIIEKSPPASRSEIQKKISLILRSKNGLYALVDYVNFNGEGLHPTEHYQTEGWGLLHVLKEMKLPDQDDEAIEQFVGAILTILDRRVKNSPPERNETRWLPGWQKRIHTYLTVTPPAEVFSEEL